MTIAEHLERYLGPIAEGWGDDTSDGAIRVVRFANQPEPGVSTYATLGLSARILPMKGGRPARQELLFVAKHDYPSQQVASFLLTFAEYVASKQQALLRGDVVGPAAPIIPGVQAKSVYAAIPVVFDDGLATFSGSQPPTVIVWLLPLVAREPAWVRSNGWDAFEDALEAAEVDLFDLDREPVMDAP
jgi:hypothetical protein